MWPPQLNVVFCLPGASFSGRFLECWSELVAFCLSNNIRPVVSRKQSCNIYYVRNMCLGADVSRGIHQKPFDGKVSYDYLMWIDSDVLFSPQHFVRLLQHDADIVSGLYMMEGGQAFAAVEKWDEEFFAQNGYFKFLTPEDLGPRVNGQAAIVAPVPDVPANPVISGPVASGISEIEHRTSNIEYPLIDVAYAGMGFMLVKKGVFEALEYPWFRPLEKKIGDMVDFTMEDVSFCLRAREKGFKVKVDPAVRVGHEKGVVL